MRELVVYFQLGDKSSATIVRAAGHPPMLSHLLTQRVHGYGAPLNNQIRAGPTHCSRSHSAIGPPGSYMRAL
eukprot:8372841-Pyramimonas_sp.AAC.1